MKKLLRRILFTKCYIYSYPYSLENLNNDLKKILDSNYFNEMTNLRGKNLTKNQFSLWEKWSIFRGIHSFDALAFFSGKRYNKNNKTFINGMIYPNPFFVLGFYFVTIVFILLLFLDFEMGINQERNEVLIPLGLISVLLYFISIYFRYRIRKTIEHELKLKKNAPQHAI